MMLYVMYRSIQESLPSPLTGDILGVSGVDNFKHLFDPSARLTEVHYPEVDMQNLPLADASFDDSSAACGARTTGRTIRSSVPASERTGGHYGRWPCSASCAGPRGAPA
jgi:hypothetical protein